MSSIIYSAKCSIKTQPYHLRIYIDNDCSSHSVSTVDDIFLKIDTDESTSSVVNILNSFRIQFESLIDQKSNSKHENDDTVPEMIFLNKLLSIKQSVTSLEEAHSLSIAQCSEWYSSQDNSKRPEMLLSESAQVDLSYIDVSELFLWTVKRIQLEMDPAVADQLGVILTRFLAKLKHRPRHLLVFINPQCGKGEGCSVYEKNVSPLFKEVNIDVETIYTKRANYARDYIIDQSLDDYDGLISVGGDGMFSELCHSLLLKTAQQAGLNIDNPNTHLKRPSLRIGVIPAGSTDAITFGTTGHNDPITSALQIIVGESLLIDIATVHSERGFVCFMATMLAYGFFGNIIRQSDHWRIFGPLRYTLAGVFQFIQNRSYPIELTITQAPEKCHSKSESNSHDRLDNSIKRRDVSGETSNLNEKSSLPLQIKRQGQYRTINCLNMSCRCDKSRYGMSPSVHLGDGSFDLILVKRSWYLNFFRFLHHVAEDGRAIEDLSNVERFRAIEVVIRPIVTREKEQGNWACDGEVFKASEVRIRSHHQALNLFASGIRLDQIKKINEEDSKIHPITITARSHSTYRLIYFTLLLLFLFFSYCYFLSW